MCLCRPGAPHSYPQNLDPPKERFGAFWELVKIALAPFGVPWRFLGFFLWCLKKVVSPLWGPLTSHWDSLGHPWDRFGPFRTSFCDLWKCCPRVGFTIKSGEAMRGRRSRGALLEPLRPPEVFLSFPCWPLGGKKVPQEVILGTAEQRTPHTAQHTQRKNTYF